MNDDRIRTAADARHSARQDFRAVTGTLLAEFAGAIPAGTVIRVLAQAREQLLGSGVRAGLADAAASMARIRLSDVLPAHRSSG